MPPPIYISLSQALSWLAFGELKDRKELNSELAGASFKLPLDVTLQRLAVALETLAEAAHAGQVELQGKQHASSGLSATAATIFIPTVAMADYRAFDITTDGLRMGTGLLWLDEDISRSIQSARGSHFSGVMVKATDLRKHLRPLFVAPRQPTVAVAQLQQWYAQLPDADRDLPLKELWSLAVAAFPTNSVPRRYLETLVQPRRRGRPKKSP